MTQIPLSSWREIVLGLFPFLARLRVRPVSEGGALEVRSAAGKLELEGGGAAVLRSSDIGGRLLFDPGVPGVTPPALFYSSGPGVAWVVVAMVPGGATVGGTVPPATPIPGTAITLGPGSGKVTCG